MGDFFQWISGLEPELRWAILAISAFVMAIVPYAGLFFRFMKAVFSNSRFEVVDFSWRLIPDVNLGTSGSSSFYVAKSESPVLYEGMTLMLNWHVRGAYRIDVLPLGRNLKGNRATVILKPGENTYLLVAYTPKGKISRKLRIDGGTVKRINTLNLSGESHFGQPQATLNTSRISEQQTVTRKFSKQGAACSFVLLNSSRWHPTSRMNELVSQRQSSSTSTGKIKTHNLQPGRFTKAIREFPIDKQLN